MDMAHLQSIYSNDYDTKVGCVIVKDGEVIAKGFNYAIDIFNENVPVSGSKKYEFMIHAEIKAVAEAANMGIQLHRSTAYVTLSPCSNCMRTLYLAGIQEIIFEKEYKDWDIHKKMKDLPIRIEKIEGYTKIKLGNTQGDWNEQEK